MFANGESTMPREDVRLLLAAVLEPTSSTALLAVREETDVVANIVPTKYIISSARQPEGTWSVQSRRFTRRIQERLRHDVVDG
jgi:hypothetical protein